MKSGEKGKKTTGKRTKAAKNSSIPAKTGENPIETDEKELNSSGKIFGVWTFESLEETFGVKGRKAIFAARYASHENGKRAATEAGYSPRSATIKASILLTEENVRKSVDALLKAKRENIAEACGVTAEWVINQFKEMHAHCSKVTKRKNSSGEESERMEYPDGALRALESLGKIAGVMVEKTKTELSAEIKSQIETKHVLEFGDPNDSFDDIPGG